MVTPAEKSNSPRATPKNRPFADARVKAVFDVCPAATRRSLLQLRALIFETAAQMPEVGALIETLKWGQPAYLPEKPRIGSTLRIDALRKGQSGYALYFHCQSTLGASFRRHYPGLFAFEGDRAIVFSDDAEIPRDALKHCIALALTYHLKSRGS